MEVEGPKNLHHPDRLLQDPIHHPKIHRAVEELLSQLARLELPNK
jgi:hypothetical protein